MNLKTTIRIFTFVFICSSLFASCTKETDEKNHHENINTLKKSELSSPASRALARWNALIEKEWTKAYSYETPSYRKTYSRNDFINSFGTAVTWVGIEHISSVKINENVIDLKLKLLFIYNMSGKDMKIPTMITERWQLIDSNWWHVKQK